MRNTIKKLMFVVCMATMILSGVFVFNEKNVNASTGPDFITLTEEEAATLQTGFSDPILLGKEKAYISKERLINLKFNTENGCSYIKDGQRIVIDGNKYRFSDYSAKDNRVSFSNPNVIGQKSLVATMNTYESADILAPGTCTIKVEGKLFYRSAETQEITYKTITLEKTLNVEYATKKVWFASKVSHMYVGDKYSAQAYADNQYSHKYFSDRYRSSNTKVATIDRYGHIKAVGAGTTTISCDSENPNAKASFVLKVDKSSVRAITAYVPYKTLGLGEKYQVKHKITINGYGAKKDVKYRSSNTKVATISSKGIVTAKRKGTTTITIYSKYNKYKRATMKVYVKDGIYKSTISKKMAKKYSDCYLGFTTKQKTPKHAFQGMAMNSEYYAKVLSLCDAFSADKMSYKTLEKKLRNTSYSTIYRSGKYIDDKYSMSSRKYEWKFRKHLVKARKYTFNGYSEAKIAKARQDFSTDKWKMNPSLSEFYSGVVQYCRVYYNKKTNKTTMYFVYCDR